MVEATNRTVAGDQLSLPLTDPGAPSPGFSSSRELLRSDQLVHPHSLAAPYIDPTNPRNESASGN